MDEQLEEMDANLGEARRTIKEMERSFWSSLFTDLCCFACCCNNSNITTSQHSTGDLQTETGDPSKETNSWFNGSSLSALKEKTGVALGFGGAVEQQQQQQQVKTISTTSMITFNDEHASSGGGKKADESYEAELSANLAGVDAFLGGLRHMALDMDAQIGRQNEQLDELNVKAAGNWAAMGKASAAITKLISDDWVIRFYCSWSRSLPVFFLFLSDRVLP